MLTGLATFKASFTAMGLTRGQQVKHLASLIGKYVVEGHEERIRTTGALTPTRSLRHKATRELFVFATNLDGRWFTAAIVKDCLRQLLKEKRFDLPAIPGCSEETWLNDESSSLQKIFMRAKRSCAKPGPDELVSEAESMNPDEAETLPWPMLDPNEDPCVDLILCL